MIEWDLEMETYNKKLISLSMFLMFFNVLLLIFIILFIWVLT